MKETTLTIEQIEILLAGKSNSPFYCRQHLVVPNVDWGFLNHEADLLIMSKSRYLTEVEIKRSWQDFVADFEKKHNHYDQRLSHFFYAVPYSIASKVFDWLYVGEFDAKYWFSHSTVTAYTEHNPLRCGLIIYRDDATPWCGRGCNLNVGSQRLGNYKVSEDEEHQLLRLLGLRVWRMKSMVSCLQKKKSAAAQKKSFSKSIIETYNHTENIL